MPIMLRTTYYKKLLFKLWNGYGINDYASLHPNFFQREKLGANFIDYISSLEILQMDLKSSIHFSLIQVCH